MPTLNDAPFKIIRQVFTTVQNNSIKDILGSDTVSVEHMGYSTEPLRLICFVQNEDEYDNFKEEYHSSGTQILIIHENSGRQYTVYGLGSTTEIDGEIENYKQGIVFLATFKQATPYKESTEEITRTKSITTQNQEWSVDDPYINLLKNEGFEDWGAGASAPPDEWLLAGVTATVAQESVIVHDGTYSVAVTHVSEDCGLYQQYTDYASLAGETLTFGAWVKTSTANQARIYLYDGVTYFAISDWHTGSGNWEWITVTGTVGSSPTMLQIICNVVTAGTAYFDGAVLVEGSFIPSSGKNIATEGNVDAVPDIKITNSLSPMTVNATYNAPSTIPSGLTWDGNNIWSCDNNSDKIYKHNADMTVDTTYNSPSLLPRGLTWDGNNIWSCDANTLKIYKHNADMTVNATYNAPGTSPSGLTWDGNNIWSCDAFTNNIYKHNADMTVNATYAAPSTDPYGLTWDGNNIWSCDFTSNKIYKHNTDIITYTTYGAPFTAPSGLAWSGASLWNCDYDSDKIYQLTGHIKNPIVYNTADTTVKCSVCNKILTGAIHIIKPDGTGTINYDDDFTTAKWAFDATFLNITHDTINNELDIADDGYIYWPEDTKYPITRTPTLTARINITAGTPTIQISTDASTWYDIDTAIVDDVETVYPLDSDGNLSLAGKTVFYWRIDCVKAAAATCSIKSFKLDIAIHTIYAKNPKITKGASASTFRIDQDPDSGLACIVALIFRHRWWT